MNAAVCKLTKGEQGIRHAMSWSVEPLSGDHWAVVANMSLGQQFAQWGQKSLNREDGTTTRAISVCKRPRRVKMDASSALKFQDTMSNDKDFKQASIDFMDTNPSNWTDLAREIKLLKLPSLLVTSDSLRHALTQEGCHTASNNTDNPSESDHCLQVHQAEITLCCAMNGLDEMDFSDIRSKVTVAADIFF